jgi:hypothetical protein
MVVLRRIYEGRFFIFSESKDLMKKLCKMQKQGLGCKNWEEQNKILA